MGNVLIEVLTDAGFDRHGEARLERIKLGLVAVDQTARQLIGEDKRCF